MNVCLKAAVPEDKEPMRNLLEKYLYEFSEWEGQDVDGNGLYGYPYLDAYWTDEKRYPFLILVDGKLAGFAMVNCYPIVDTEADYTMAEFFVMRKYRKRGVGRQAAFQLFGRFPGKWQLKYYLENKASSVFWNRIVGEYTGRAYERLQGSLKEAGADAARTVVLLSECGEARNG